MLASKRTIYFSRAQKGKVAAGALLSDLCLMRAGRPYACVIFRVAKDIFGGWGIC